ncbi:uncharacterized protein LOC115879562 [Sitophilus oryzae]|uniref:Uncharacterized protein LOC115879562 n=1 Tax=Sitophilus oryzae TaxID=7048 RepID=A0A6J2XLW7_SITOR|nr:uncharacterized protein LOC115879562 [Sitophilus oryzae]
MVKNWNYISSSLNPADIISRGCTLHELKYSELWWHGPEYLQKPVEFWPTDCNITKFAKISEKVPEYKPQTMTFFNTNTELHEIFERYSNYNKLIRVFGYCLRFINNLKLKKDNREYSNSLSPAEINNSIESLSKMVQITAFPSDFRSLQESGSVNPKSNLRSLSPILENGLILVGGRLQNANICYHSKHPIILPHSHPFTRLIIENEHLRSLHAGTQTTLSFIRQRFWPLNGKNSVKNCIRKCVICFKSKPKGLTAKMGQLPAPRVVPTSPFLTSSIDFAGPYELKDGKLKNRRIIKAYICVFVCMATKAIHLELITDLTTDGF